MTDTVKKPEVLEYGVQPLDAIMTENELSNNNLVSCLEGKLTHKTVQKARKGRRLTTRMQLRVAEALNFAVAPELRFRWTELFNYKGR